jgi:hypothetical protein
VVEVRATSTEGEPLEVTSAVVEVVEEADFGPAAGRGSAGGDGGQEALGIGGHFGGFMKKYWGGLVPGPPGGWGWKPELLCQDACTLAKLSVLSTGPNTWKVHYQLCNQGNCASDITVEVTGTAPSGKQWKVVEPAVFEKMAKSSCSSPILAPFFDLELLDTDPNTEPLGGSAIVTLTARGNKGPVSFPGTPPGPPHCSVKAVEVCYGCPPPL